MFWICECGYARMIFPCFSEQRMTVRWQKKDKGAVSAHPAREVLNRGGELSYFTHHAR